jgi:hypothetical protein
MMPGSLTVCHCVVRRLAPVALDCFSRRDPVGRRSPKGCSRLAWLPRTSQATTGTKGEWNLGLEERLGQKR